MERITRIILGVVIVILGYFVYESIAAPIREGKEIARVEAKVIERLKDIRFAQLAYKSLHGEYAADFDTLISVVKHGQFPIIKVEGDPEDTLSVVTRDTSYVNIIDSLFGPDFAIDSLRYVPVSDTLFHLEARKIVKGGIRVPVFMAVDTKPIDESRPLQVGSLYEGSTSGNWE